MPLLVIFGSSQSESFCFWSEHGLSVCAFSLLILAGFTCCLSPHSQLLLLLLLPLLLAATRAPFQLPLGAALSTRDLLIANSNSSKKRLLPDNNALVLALIKPTHLQPSTFSFFSFCLVFYCFSFFFVDVLHVKLMKSFLTS